MSNPVLVPTFKAAAVAVVAALAITSVARAMQGDFNAADANHDGKVTLSEFKAYATKMLMASNGLMAHRFQQMSPDQQAAHLQQRFEKADLGHKGYLTATDWARP
jgi:Ca2+-binding EF-hand superfamily protein